jgi:Pirin C-terminal cupin domain
MHEPKAAGRAAKDTRHAQYHCSAPFRQHVHDRSVRQGVADHHGRKLDDANAIARGKPQSDHVIDDEARPMLNACSCPVRSCKAPGVLAVGWTQIHAAFAAQGGTFEMVQLWVNLPAKHKMAKPSYQTLLAAEVPSVKLPDSAGTVRVIAGDYEGHKGPARTFTPIDIWDVRLKAGHEAAFTLPKGHALAVVVLAGTVEINGAEIAREAQTVLFDDWVSCRRRPS